MLKKYLGTFGEIFANFPPDKRSFVSIHDKQISSAEKEAILVITGFGSLMYGNRWQKEFFLKHNAAYDIFIPKYIERNSIKDSLNTLQKFLVEQELSKYKRVHIFTYIIGSWVINEYIRSHPENNIASIIYDRSPLQERAPYVVIKDNILLYKWAVGNIMREFAETPYPPIPKNKMKVGIIVESKATPLVMKHKATTMSLGAVRWDLKSFDQEHDDHFYTRLDHDQMYKRFDVIGKDIMNFFKAGKFTSEAKREPFDWDPFVAFQE